MKNIYAILFLFLGISLLAASEPASDAVYLQMTREYELQEDGTLVYTHHHQLKLLTYYAVNSRYGETFIVYDTLRQTLNIERSVTTMADGRQVPSPDNAFNLVLPRAALEAPAYNHLREMVVTHTGLEPQAVIDLKYTLTTKPGLLKGIMVDEVLAMAEPVRELIVRIKVPENLDLRYRLNNAEGSAVITRSDGKTVYEWRLTDVAHFHYEPMQIPAPDFVPHLVASSLDNWEEALESVCHQAAYKNIQLPQELTTWIDKIKNKTLSPQQQLLQIQNKIASEIATFPIEPAMTGFQCRPLQAVWESNGGTPVEKARLMAKALDLAGINASPVLAGRYHFTFDSPPVLQAFDEALVHVFIDDHQYLLPVDRKMGGNETDHYAGDALAILSQGMIKTLIWPGRTGESHFSKLNGHFQIDEAGIMSGDAGLKVSGAAHAYWQLLGSDKRESATLGKLFPGYELSSGETLGFGFEEASYLAELTGKNPLESDEDYVFLNIPASSGAVNGLSINGLTQTRHYPLHLRYAAGEENRLTITLPEKWQLVTPVVNKQMANEAGRVSIKITRNGRDVHIERSLAFEKTHIPAELYPEFLKLWKAWSEPGTQELVFRK